MIKKAIFDMDGLIFDSERLFMNCLAESMALRGYSLTEAIYINTLGLARDDCRTYMSSVFGTEYPFDEISNEARSKIVTMSHSGLPVKPGIRELLDHLRARGVICVVASSTETQYIRTYLENSGLTQYFSDIFGGETVKRSKPEPDIFLRALGDTNKNEAIIFEDSENGLIAAQRAGISAICIPDMKRPSDEILSGALSCVESAFDVINMEDLL